MSEHTVRVTPRVWEPGTPEISGFRYLPDDAAYRIVCEKCGATAGTLGRSEDYAHGWLDAWAQSHLFSGGCS